VQFDQDRNRIRFYDPDSQTWSAGAPGAALVLASRAAALDLAGARVQGAGPTGPSVAITWAVTFRAAAVQQVDKQYYQQFLQITPDHRPGPGRQLDRAPLTAGRVQADRTAGRRRSPSPEVGSGGQGVRTACPPAPWLTNRRRGILEATARALGTEEASNGDRGAAAGTAADLGG
jgi:hypothetical protein